MEGLRKRFGSAEALAGIDLSRAAPAACSGLLGPNGAGKTTTIRILTTLLRADGGRAVVAGVDVARDPAGARRRIGLVGQSAAVDEVLSGRQNLVLFGRLYHLGAAPRPGAGGRTARALRPRGHGRQAGRAVLGRHAPPPRPRRGPDPLPRGAVLGRADDRPRPARAQRGLGGHSCTCERRRHRAADDPAARGGRPARRSDRGHRPRARDRGGHAAGVEGVAGRRLDRRRRCAPTEAVARGRGAPAPPLGRPSPRSTPRRAASAHPSPTAWARSARSCASSASCAEDIALRRPTLDEVFLALTEEPGAATERPGRRPRRRRRAHPTAETTA